VVFQQEVVCQAMGECSQILSFKAWDIETIAVTGVMLGKGDSSECHANVLFRCHLTFFVASWCAVYQMELCKALLEGLFLTDVPVLFHIPNTCYSG
jgi:hypothetical protein